MAEVTEYYVKEACGILGINAVRHEVSFVKKMLQKRMAKTNCLSIEAYLEFLHNNKVEEQALESLLQNSYSEFFRNPLTYSVLEKIVFPSLLVEKRQKGKELRIWSAACASGQEPYSIAMLLEESECRKDVPVRYRIFATDKSKVQIKKAEHGMFSTLGVGHLSMKRLLRWFDGKLSDNRERHYVIKNEIKRNIDFSVFDLFEAHANVPPSSIFGDFDLVFCTNLLFYYKPAYQKIIIDRIANSMTSNGLLIVGESERELLKQQGFTEIFYQSGIFCR